MKLYAVTKGEYSDYRIITLTKNKKTAEKIAKEFSDRYEMAMVEEYEDGSFCIGRIVYEVIVENGDLKSVEAVMLDQFREINAEVMFNKFGKWYYTYVIADEKDKAAKIGKDRIMQYIATSELG